VSETGELACVSKQSRWTSLLVETRDRRRSPRTPGRGQRLDVGRLDVAVDELRRVEHQRLDAHSPRRPLGHLDEPRDHRRDIATVDELRPAPPRALGRAA
jgi:hypothetical protein